MTAPVQENTDARDIAGLSWRTSQLARRPGIKPQAGVAIFEIKVFEDDEVVDSGDGKFKFDIPSELDEAALIDVEAWVTVASASGTVVITLYNDTQAVDMLSTAITIDVGELNDKSAAIPFVINVANSEVAYGDELWINVDNAGTGAVGLGVKVAFTPADTAAIAVQGAKGDPGGATQFQGPWMSGTTYNAGDIVTNNNITYIVTADHTSDATTEPGVGVDWEDFLDTMIDLPLTANISFNVVSAAGTIADGAKTAAVMPFDATISQAILLADVAGSATVDIWRTDYGGYPPSIADSITGGTPPTLTGTIKNLDSTLLGWDTALNEGDILVFVATDVIACRRLTLALSLTK